MNAKIADQISFGLWHNGWCTFITAQGQFNGFGYVGTQEEAQEGRAQFVKEGRDPSEYEVVPFDPSREPLVKPGRPTPTQLEALKYVAEKGTCTRFPFPPNWYRTATILLDRGWVQANITAEGQTIATRPFRLTTAGKSFLDS